MPNPFNFNGGNSNFLNIQQLYQMVMNSKNPMQLLEQMSANNPQLRQVVQTLKNGANPQSLFVELCKQRGVDPNAFLKSIQGKY